jgi:hypothetical protein
MSDLIERRMYAYYYSFNLTGVDVVDKVLSAVAWAGVAYHHTDSWDEPAGPYADLAGETPVDWIQNAAEEAAAALEAAEARVKELEAMVSWVDVWVSNPAGSYSLHALDGLFAATRERIAALSPAHKGDEQ